VLTLAGTAAAITIWRAPVQDVTHLGCFETVSLATNVDVIGYTSNPLAACGAIMHWPSVPGSSSPHGSLCVLSDGSLAGFPPSRRSNVCGFLGLATYNGHLQNPPVAHFEQAAQNYFTGHPCMVPATARQVILRLLENFKISGWQVRITGSKSTSACATLSIQVKSRIVGLVGFVFH